MFAAKGKSSPEASNKSEHELKPLLLVGEDETSNYRKSRQEEDDKKLVNGNYIC